MGDELRGYDPGSFRDRGARVFYAGDGVFRALSAPAAKEWDKLAATAFFQRFMRDGQIVHTEPVALGEAVLPDARGEWVAVLRHQRIPFVSYPYEWSFGMLKDAALLHLDLLADALREEMSLKDGSAFNIQWVGSRPTFIDIGSFETLARGAPWSGYRQFCQMFLYPLFLEAYRGVPFQAWLRGSIDGITPAQMWRLMALRDVGRPGVLKHVYLQARLQESSAVRSADVRAELRAAGFHRGLIEANVQNLRRLVRALAPRHRTSPWSDYGTAHRYAQADEAAKEAFVRAAASRRWWPLVWDLGANVGRYARIVGAHAGYVVAMDTDPVVVDLLYEALKREGETKILPLVVDLANPSPGLGWRGGERGALEDRGRPDLTLCLALLHHLVIAANIPMDAVLGWLRSLQSCLVIEFVTREDRMVQRLLQNRDDGFADYELRVFERQLAQGFEIVERQRLTSGTRILYFATPRASTAEARGTA